MTLVEYINFIEKEGKDHTVDEKICLLTKTIIKEYDTEISQINKDIIFLKELYFDLIDQQIKSPKINLFYLIIILILIVVNFYNFMV